MEAEVLSRCLPVETEKSTKCTSIGITGLWAKNFSHDLLNTVQVYNPLNREFLTSGQKSF